MSRTLIVKVTGKDGSIFPSNSSAFTILRNLLRCSVVLPVAISIILNVLPTCFIQGMKLEVKSSNKFVPLGSFTYPHKCYECKQDEDSILRELKFAICRRCRGNITVNACRGRSLMQGN
ncbi:hypothetical protein MKX01_017471 [Papaver californicum]|nr:hypothetical protein MKX01_017471 [Papaver californicum]